MSASVKPASVSTCCVSGKQLADMVAGGQLRHHAAKAGMQLHLAVDGLREQASVAIVDGDTGLVTGGLDAEYPHAVCSSWALNCLLLIDDRFDRQLSRLDRQSTTSVATAILATL
jgi:hypothetical protein